MTGAHRDSEHGIAISNECPLMNCQSQSTSADLFCFDQVVQDGNQDYSSIKALSTVCRK